MDSEKRISPAVINRLPRYYRYLGDLLESDITRISSKELSAKMNITASQIRQDLNNFGGFGQQAGGAGVDAQGIGDGVREAFHGDTSFLLKFNFHAVIGR
jgi:NADH/NAD ratio-sensing transcriptional regulator Rex